MGGACYACVSPEQGAILIHTTDVATHVYSESIEFVRGICDFLFRDNFVCVKKVIIKDEMAEDNIDIN